MFVLLFFLLLREPLLGFRLGSAIPFCFRRSPPLSLNRQSASPQFDSAFAIPVLVLPISVSVLGKLRLSRVPGSIRKGIDPFLVRIDLAFVDSPLFSLRFSDSVRDLKP